MNIPCWLIFPWLTVNSSFISAVKACASSTPVNKPLWWVMSPPFTEWVPLHLSIVTWGFCNGTISLCLMHMLWWGLTKLLQFICHDCLYSFPPYLVIWKQSAWMWVWRVLILAYSRQLCFSKNCTHIRSFSHFLRSSVGWKTFAVYPRVPSSLQANLRPTLSRSLADSGPKGSVGAWRHFTWTQKGRGLWDKGSPVL